MFSNIRHIVLFFTSDTSNIQQMEKTEICCS